MRRLLHLLFAVCLSVSLYAQNPTVVLTTIGEGYTVDEARNHALRTAIETAYATFISSDLTIVNDEIEKEEIAIIASACINGYKEIDRVKSTDNLWVVTVQSEISPGRIIKHFHAEGDAILNVDGSKLTESIEMQRINDAMLALEKENKEKAKQHLKEKCAQLAPDVFDVMVEVDQARLTSNGGLSFPISVVFKRNDNTPEYVKFILSTLRSIHSIKDPYTYIPIEYSAVEKHFYASMASQPHIIDDLALTIIPLPLKGSEEFPFLAELFTLPVTSKELTISYEDKVKSYPFEMMLTSWEKNFRVCPFLHGYNGRIYINESDTRIYLPVQAMIGSLDAKSPSEYFKTKHPFYHDYLHDFTCHISQGIVYKFEFIIDDMTEDDIKNINSISVQTRINTDEDSDKLDENSDNIIDRFLSHLEETSILYKILINLAVILIALVLFRLFIEILPGLLFLYIPAAIGIIGIIFYHSFLI